MKHFAGDWQENLPEQSRLRIKMFHVEHSHHLYIVVSFPLWHNLNLAFIKGH